MSNRSPLLLLMIGLFSYILIISPFTSYMRNKPIEEKLGFVPSTKLMKSFSADQKELVGASLIFKVMMYYGGKIEMTSTGAVITEQPDLQGMSRLLHGAVQLDPYNMDAYYFAQGFLTWDAKQFKVANDLLEYGMRYRSWDSQLPFFAGFNNAYFLKDFKKAAEFFKRSGELSGSDLHINLAGRYFLESGQTELAIGYLATMAKSAKNQVIKQTYQTRLKAFSEVLRIEKARDKYAVEYGNPPSSLDQLLNTGYLDPAPSDPYGGTFYIDSTGKVVTTSKFAFVVKKK